MPISRYIPTSAIARPGVIPNAAARPASPYEGQTVYLTDTDLLQIWTGTAWRTLAAAAPTNGAVLQVVNASYGTQTNNTTNVFADTGLSATITPTSTSSKIHVFVHQAGCLKRAGDIGSAVVLRLLRGSTELIVFENLGAYTATSVANGIGTCSTSYLDSPNTTSAVTYKTQFRNIVNANGVEVQSNGNNFSTMTLMEIAA